MICIGVCVPTAGIPPNGFVDVCMSTADIPPNGLDICLCQQRAESPMVSIAHGQRHGCLIYKRLRPVRATVWLHGHLSNITFRQQWAKQLRYFTFALCRAMNAVLFTQGVALGYELLGFQPVRYNIDQLRIAKWFVLMFACQQRAFR